MKKLFIILLCLIGISLNAATYYVSTTGLDAAAGTLAAPWLTWQKAFSTAEAGDTVYFRGGVYNIPRTDGYGVRHSPGTGQGHDGTAGNWICFFAYGDEVPILDCANVTGLTASCNVGLWLYYSDYIHIKGLQIRNVLQFVGIGGLCYGIRCEFNDHIKLENMVIHDVNGSGFELQGTIYGEVINCDVYNCCDLYAPNDPEIGEMAFMGAVELSDGYRYYYGCRAWNCSDQGFATGGSRSVTIYDHCWSFMNGYVTGNVDGRVMDIK